MHTTDLAGRDRRTDPRASRGRSLDRWLASVAAETGAAVIVVADSRGLLVGASTGGRAAERLATEARALASGDSEGLAVLRLRAWEGGLRLCAIGDLPSRLASVLAAEPGVTRILGEARA